MRKASAVFLVAVLSVSVFSAAKLHFAAVWAGAGAPAQGSEESPTMYGLAVSVFNQSWNDPRWISELELSGCKWARMNVFNENRSTHFNDSLSCFELLQNESIKCLGVFCQDLNTWKVPIGNLTEWQTLVNDALDNYGQFLDAVECWNEPDLPINQEGCMNGPQNYTEMLRILYDETKTYAAEHNKTINVVAGSIVNIYSDETSPGSGANFTQAIRDYGSDNYCDAYSMHIYKTGPGGNDSDEYLQGHTAGEAYDYIKSIADVNSTDPKPLWVSETGTHDNTDEGQASQMQTWFTELKSVSCPMVFWYNYIDPDENIHGIVQTVTFEERPAFQVFRAHAQLAQPLANTHLIVRGTDNRIYYRLYNSSSRAWEDWNVILGGATCDGPAAAVLNGELHIVVRGFSDTNVDANNTLWHISINLATGNPSDWTWLPGATLSAPALAASKASNELYLAVRGLDSRVWYMSWNGTWSSWNVILNGATCDGPAAAVLNGELHIVVRGFSETNADANNTLWHTSIDISTKTLSEWTWLPGATLSSPTLAVSDILSRYYLVVRGLDSGIWHMSWNGTWSDWSRIAGGATCDSPAATILDNDLQIVVRGSDYDSLWHYLPSNDWTRISGRTYSPPSLTS